MTTLIIGLIAALGIGGGIAVASNSGGGGNSSPAISGPVEPGEDFSFVIPEDKELSAVYENNPGAILDYNKHNKEDIAGNIKGTVSDSAAAPVRCYALLQAAKANDSSMHLDMPDFNSHIYDGQDSIKTLGLTDESGVIELTTGVLHDPAGGKFQLMDAVINRPLEDKVTRSFNMDAVQEETEFYRKLQIDDTKTYSVSGQEATVRHLNDLYLGGAPLLLSSAEFGIWTEWREDISLENVNTYVKHYYPIFLFDKSYTYTDRGTREQVDLYGNVLVVSDIEQREHPDRPNEVMSGKIKLNLNLPDASFSGRIKMNDELNKKHDLSFLGNLEADTMYMYSNNDDTVKGLGQLLDGPQGLEAVGIVHREEGGEKTSVEYVFGAREVK